MVLVVTAFAARVARFGASVLVQALRAFSVAFANGNGRRAFETFTDVIIRRVGL